MLVHLACGQPERALSLLNNMQRADLAALLVEGAPSDILPRAPHRAIFLSFARMLHTAGLGALAAFVCRERAGEPVGALVDS